MKIKRLLISFLLPLLLLSSVPQVVFAATTITERGLVTSSSYDALATIYDNIVAFDSYRTGKHEVYYIDTDTGIEKQLTNSQSDGLYSPQVYKNNVFWSENRNGQYDLFMYDIKKQKEIQLTNDIERDSNPLVSGNNIIFARSTPSENHTNLYILNYKTDQLKLLPVPQDNFGTYDISDNKIVWDDTKYSYGSPAFDIYMYNLDTLTTTQVTNDDFRQEHPRINNNTIVWADKRQGTDNPDVYMYDITTGITSAVSNTADYEAYPTIYGDYVAYTNFSEQDLHLFNIKTGENTRIELPGTQSQVEIYKKSLIWADYRNPLSAPDIYLGIINKK